MYVTGTMQDFETWHTIAKIAEGIPPEGRVGFVNGKPAPQNQRTIAVSDPVKHPGKDEYAWEVMGSPMGQLRTEAEVKQMGYLSENIAVKEEVK